MIAVNGVTDTNSVQGSLLTDRDEIQMDFAKLQMDLANINKSDVKVNLDKIKEQQKQIATITNLIDDLRSRIGYKTHDDEHIAIPLHIAEQCKACGVDCASGDNVSLGSVKATIKSLEAKKDAINSNIQRMMVEIQDSMGKYSVYTDGAESQIRKFTESLINQSH